MNLPDDLWGRAYGIGRAAVPLRGRVEQVVARENLLRVLANERIEELPDALTALIQARQEDVNGKPIPLGKQHLNALARVLCAEIEGWMEQNSVIHRMGSDW